MASRTSKIRKPRQRPAVAKEIPQPSPARPLLVKTALAALIALVTLIGYLPTMHNGFVWDDDSYLTENPIIKSPTGLYQFWFTSQPVDYYPISNSSLWLEWRLWGTNAAGYHATNLALHIITAIALWAVLEAMSIPGAFLAGLLFAVHPVNVESVAWIAQRKDLLALLFSLASVFCFIKAGRKFNGWYWLCLFLFLLAMLSKGSVVTLPAIVLVVGWWTWKEIKRRDLLLAAPLFGIALIVTALIMWFWQHSAPMFGRGIAGRLLGAGAVVWFYLYKALWPKTLLFVYPEWQISPANLLWWIPLIAVLLISIGVLLLRTSWRRPAIAAWFFFLLAIFPAMGFVDAYFMRYSLVADHYQHLAIIAPIVAVAAIWSAWRIRHQTAAVIAAGLLVAVLTILTFRQTRIYKDSETIYEATLAKNPTCWLAYANLGQIRHAAGRRQEAIALFEKALQFATFDDSQAMVHSNLGGALADLDRNDEAMSHYQQAIQVRPTYGKAHYNLGNLLNKLGRRQEAIASFRRALQYEPNLAQTHNNLACVLIDTNDIAGAVTEGQIAVRLDPNYSVGYYNLGNALAKAGRTDEAIAAYQQALRLSPDFAEAHSFLAAALNTKGNTPAAIAHYRRALQLRPDDPLACNNLAWIYAADPDSRNRNPSEAVRLAEHAAELTRHEDPSILDTLAAAYALAGRLPDAVDTAQKASKLAQLMGNTALSKEIENRLTEYRARQSPQPIPN